MKKSELNQIMNAQANEVKAAEEARIAAARQAELDSVQEGTILTMLNDIYSGRYLPILDDNDNIIGINCPEYVTGLNVTEKVGSHIVMGKTEEEKEKDKLELEKFIRSYGYKAMRFFILGLKLKEANVHPEYAEEINGTYYFVITEWKKVIDEDGNTIVNIERDIQDPDLLQEILIDKLHIAVPQVEPEYDDYYDEDESDEDEYYEDEE